VDQPEELHPVEVKVVPAQDETWNCRYNIKHKCGEYIARSDGCGRCPLFTGLEKGEYNIEAINVVDRDIEVIE